jgi:hypothetical protein
MNFSASNRRQHSCQRQEGCCEHRHSKDYFRIQGWSSKSMSILTIFVGSYPGERAEHSSRTTEAHLLGTRPQVTPFSFIVS